MGVQLERTGLRGESVWVGGRRSTHEVDLREVLNDEAQSKRRIMGRDMWSKAKGNCLVQTSTIGFSRTANTIGNCKPEDTIKRCIGMRPGLIVMVSGILYALCIFFSERDS